MQKKLIICGTIGSQYLCNIYPVLNRIINSDLQGNTYHYMHIVTFLTSVFFYSSGWPQNKFPGKCDILFHGHQIFHVFIAITTWLQVKSVRIDMKSYWNSPTVEDSFSRSDLWNQVSIFFAVHAIFSVLVIRHFYRKIQSVLILSKN